MEDSSIVKPIVTCSSETGLGCTETDSLESQLAFSHFLELFDSQVEIHPENCAVISEDLELSYKELHKKSIAYSGFLSSLGVGVDDIVAVILPRSIDLIPILIAIMRVGAIYVPINPAHPSKSIELIVEGASPVLLVCDQVGASVAARFPHIRKWNLQDFTDEYPSGEPGVFTKTDKGSTAYIIYTSGSTGKPKGVRVPHSALCAFLLAMQNEISCDSGDRFAAITTICFDIAYLEMFLPLTLGASVALVPMETGYDGEALASFLEKKKVTVFQATPATYRLLIAGGWEQSGTIKKLLCGGEALPAKLARKLLDMADEVWNVYGPTEATIWATAKKLVDVKGKPNIGKPIAGTRCYILGEDKRLLAQGEEGELYIGGLGLAEGYHCAPEKTADRFVKIELTAGQKERIYQTGDKALINPQGEIEYLGRMDFQVKVRGYRVELQEVEFIAMSHHEVNEFVAISFTDSAGENSISGFYTVVKGSFLGQDALRTFLAEHLADYKVPTSLMAVEEMPLNANGKIDRKALESLPRKKKPQKSAYIHDFDRQIYKAWCDVLKIDQCGDQDDFFLLGGHSISAYLLIKKVEELSGIRSPLGTLFTNPKLGDFLKALREQDDNPVATRVTLNKAKDDARPNSTVYFVCGINIYQNLADVMPDTVQANAIYVELEQRFLLEDYGNNNRKEPPLTTQKLAQFYVKTILSNDHEEPIDLCGISYGGMLALEVASQLERQGVNVRSVYMLDSVLPSSYKKTLLFFILQGAKRVCLCLSKWFSGMPILGKVASLLESLVDRSAARRVIGPHERNLQAAITTVKPEGMTYSGRIVLVKAKGHVADSKGITWTHDYGWQDALGRSVDIYTVPGDHIGMIDRDNSQNVAKIMLQENRNG